MWIHKKQTQTLLHSIQFFLACFDCHKEYRQSNNTQLPIKNHETKKKCCRRTLHTGIATLNASRDMCTTCLDVESSQNYQISVADRSFDVPNSLFNCSAHESQSKKKKREKDVISMSTWSEIDTKKKWKTYDRSTQWLLVRIEFERKNLKLGNYLMTKATTNTPRKTSGHVRER